MTRHTRALAQHLAWELQQAHCRDHTTAWTAHEDGYATAATCIAAQHHLSAIVAICDGCPALETCAERARIDRYTGLAAGTAYRNGRPRPPTAAS